MEFQVQYDPSINAVVGEFKGNLNRSSLKAYVANIASVVRAHSCKRFLNDLRAAQINLSIIDVFELPSVVVSEDFNRTWRRAVLLPPESTINKSFFENVNSNRGVEEKIFTDYLEAIAWLQLK